MRVVIVLPTYNAVANVATIVPALLGLGCSPDVLVVDDNSSDGTGEQIRTLMQGEPRLRLHPRPRQQGLGAAYVAGFTAALSLHRYDAVVQIDADGAHSPGDVPRLLAALDSADLAIGSRYVAGGGVSGWRRSRRARSRVENLYARAWLRLGVHDLTAGFKAWRAETLAQVELGQIRSTGYSFQVETTARAVALGARVVEVPIMCHERRSGASRMNHHLTVDALRRIPSVRHPTWTR